MFGQTKPAQNLYFYCKKKKKTKQIKKPSRLTRSSSRSSPWLAVHHSRPRSQRAPSLRSQFPNALAVVAAPRPRALARIHGRAQGSIAVRRRIRSRRRGGIRSRGAATGDGVCASVRGRHGARRHAPQRPLGGRPLRRRRRRRGRRRPP